MPWIVFALPSTTCTVHPATPDSWASVSFRTAGSICCANAASGASSSWDAVNVTPGSSWMAGLTVW